MTNEEAIAKAEQELQTSDYIAECTVNPGLHKIHATRSTWLSIIVRLAKQALDAVDTFAARQAEHHLDGTHADFRCSNCEQTNPMGQTLYCPHCGKPMTGANAVKSEETACSM